MFDSIPIHTSISSKLCIDECTIALLSLLSHHEMFANVADPFWITCNVQSLMQNICKMHYTTHYSSLNPLLLLSGFLLVRIQVCLSYIYTWKTWHILRYDYKHFCMFCIKLYIDVCVLCFDSEHILRAVECNIFGFYSDMCEDTFNNINCYENFYL